MKIQSLSKLDPHNCLLFALLMKWRHGGRLVYKKSPHGWWWHFWWTRDGQELWEYTPDRPMGHLPLPPPLYRGHVQVTRPGATPAVRTATMEEARSRDGKS